jgi:Spy/CpxP family protein refolding chaperone
MTPRQYMLAAALARCTFVPGTAQKRFARDIGNLPESHVLTPRQIAQLLRLVYRYRRQIPHAAQEARLDEAEALAAMHGDAFDRKPPPASKRKAKIKMKEDREPTLPLGGSCR